MKKIILSLLVTVVFIGTISAQEQEKKHEFYAGFGLVSTSSVLDVFSDMLATSLTAGTYVKNNTTWSGNIHAGYKYLPSKHTAVGLTYTYTKSTGDVSYSGSKAGTIDNLYHTIAAEFDYRYISRPMFKLYSSVGAGVTINNETYKPASGDNEKNNQAHFNFQVSPIGVKVGNSIGFFAEAGFGYKGIISAGLFASF